MLLQGYCSTRLFYFIARNTTSAIKESKTFILLQNLFYFFIAANVTAPLKQAGIARAVLGNVNSRNTFYFGHCDEKGLFGVRYNP